MEALNPAGSEPTPLKMFEKIPKIIRKKGRVAGFEKLRDMALEDWEQLSARMNPYSALKLCIEFDRHAMFAEVAQERAKGAFDRDLWDKFQNYLHGSVESAPGLNDSQETSDAEASNE
jgi:hypothetical protein